MGLDFVQGVCVISTHPTQTITPTPLFKVNHIVMNHISLYFLPAEIAQVFRCVTPVYPRLEVGRIRRPQNQRLTRQLAWGAVNVTITEQIRTDLLDFIATVKAAWSEVNDIDGVDIDWI